MKYFELSKHTENTAEQITEQAHEMIFLSSLQIFTALQTLTELVTDTQVLCLFPALH